MHPRVHRRRVGEACLWAMFCLCASLALARDNVPVAGAGDDADGMYFTAPFAAFRLKDEPYRHVDFGIDGGGSISGQFVDAHASRPLAGYAAFMQLYDTDGQWVGGHDFTTDASGYYQIHGLPSGAFHLVLSSQGPFVDSRQIYPGIPCPTNCDPLLGQPVTITAPGGIDHVDFSFHPDAIVHGKVVDATSGTGIGGATVSGYIPVSTPMGTQYALAWATTSDEPDGAYELYLRGHSTGQPYYIAAEHAAPHISTAFPGVSCTIIASCLGNAVPLTVRPADTFESIDMSLPLGSAISGMVTDALSGTPIPAFVHVYDETNERVWSGHTLSDGSYSSEAFPAATYHAVATKVGWPFGCAVYLDRPCPAEGSPVSSVDPTPLILQVGEVRSDVDFQIDTDTIFTGAFDP